MEETSFRGIPVENLPTALNNASVVADQQLIPELRSRLNQAALRLEEQWGRAGLHKRPPSFTKSHVQKFQNCAHLGLASLFRLLPTAQGINVTLGLVVEEGIRSHFALGGISHSLVHHDFETWKSMVKAQSSKAIPYLDEPGLGTEASRKVEELTQIIDQPMDWWPRTEVSASVLLGQFTLLRGRFDVLLGGSVTGKPLVILEVKSYSSAGQYGFSDLWFYILLASLRYGKPPAQALIAGTGEEGADLHLLPVTNETLVEAARRVEKAFLSVENFARAELPTINTDNCTDCLRGESCAVYDLSAVLEALRNG